MAKRFPAPFSTFQESEPKALVGCAHHLELQSTGYQKDSYYWIWIGSHKEYDRLLK